MYSFLIFYHCTLSNFYRRDHGSLSKTVTDSVALLLSRFKLAIAFNRFACRDLWRLLLLSIEKNELNVLASPTIICVNQFFFFDWHLLSTNIQYVNQNEWARIGPICPKCGEIEIMSLSYAKRNGWIINKWQQQRQIKPFK